MSWQQTIIVMSKKFMPSTKRIHFACTYHILKCNHNTIVVISKRSVIKISSSVCFFFQSRNCVSKEWKIRKNWVMIRDNMPTWNYFQSSIDILLFFSLSTYEKREQTLSDAAFSKPSTNDLCLVQILFFWSSSVHYWY